MICEIQSGSGSGVRRWCESGGNEFRGNKDTF